MKFLLLLTIIGCSFCGLASATQRDEDMPVMHMILLQFTLEGDNPYEFATYAPEFAETIESILSRDPEFDNVNAVVLGVGKSECGVSVVAVIEYTKNETSIYVDTESVIQHVIDLIEVNRQLLEDVYSMKTVRSVDADKTSIKFVSHKNAIASTQIAVGVVVGTLALIGVAAMVAGLVVYVMRTKNYEKVPLLADETPSKNRWLKLPWSKKSNSDTSEAF